MSAKIVPLTPTRLTSSQSSKPTQISFDRKELSQILAVYGQMVSQGHWKDYAMDFLSEKAVFSIYRRASEHQLYRIEKTRPCEKNRANLVLLRREVLF